MSRVKAGDAARLLSKMDQLSDEEVTSLLESMLAGEQSAGSPAVDSSASNAAPGAAAAAPEVISREAVAGLEAHDGLQLLERLEQLSDEEVAALLGEMLAEDESAPSQGSAAGGSAAGDGAGRGAVSQSAGEVSVDELSDEEVTRLLGELLRGKGEAE